MEAQMSQIQGSCHCRAVRYRVAGEIVSVVNCHCGLCRELSGSAFTSYVVVKEADLTLEQGESSLSRYDATETATRHFCRNCGTPMFNTNPGKYPSLKMVYLGTASSAAELVPRINVFCESKLPWVESIGSLKSFSAASVRGA
jgi:hypothetical protein